MGDSSDGGRRRAEAIALTNEAFYAVERGDIKAAQSHLEKALELTDEVADTHNEYATVLRRLGREDEAGKHLLRALELEPKNPKMWSGAAGWYMSRREFDKALDCILVAEQLNPRYPTIEVARMRIAQAMGADAAEVEAHRRRARALYESTGLRGDGTALKPGDLDRILTEEPSEQPAAQHSRLPWRR